METLDTSILAVLLSLLLYALQILVPLIPAILIYKIFPATEVAVAGPLSHFTVRATGAFAAYIVVFLLGLVLVRNTANLIAGLTNETVEVTAKAVLVNADGKPIREPELSQLVGSMQVKIIPDINPRTPEQIVINMPANHLPRAQLQYELEGFETATILLAQHDLTGGRVHLGEVQLRPIMNEYNPAAHERLEPAPAEFSSAIEEPGEERP